MAYKGAERRKYPRYSKTFIVSYRVYEDVDGYDLTRTKNIGLGGMLITTNKSFPVSTILSIDIRFPFLIEPLNLKGRVVESKEVVKNLIYDTHLELIDIDDETREIINKTVVYDLKKDGNEQKIE